MIWVRGVQPCHSLNGDAVDRKGATPSGPAKPAGLPPSASGLLKGKVGYARVACVRYGMGAVAEPARLKAMLARAALLSVGLSGKALKGGARMAWYGSLACPAALRDGRHTFMAAGPGVSLRSKACRAWLWLVCLVVHRRVKYGRLA